jgi:hypothetical protein
MKSSVSYAYWLCCSLALVACEQGPQPGHIEETLTKDSVPIFDSTAIKRFDSLLQAEQQRMAAEPLGSTSSPDTISMVLPEYTITNSTFSGLLHSISNEMRPCPEYKYGRIGASQGSKGFWIGVTIQDQNPFGPGSKGYTKLYGKTFSIFGVEGLNWFKTTGKTDSFQYLDHAGVAEPYDPPAWYFLVRGDSIYRGTGSSFPCE